MFANTEEKVNTRNDDKAFAVARSESRIKLNTPGETQIMNTVTTL